MLKLLIVEDERWEREGLVDFLDWNGMGIGTILTACDGIEGLEIAMAMRPEIIVTDIRMPGMNGIDMAKRIREQLPDVRIIVLTGYDDFAYARDALRFGAVDYVLKPVEEAEFKAIMENSVRSVHKSLAVLQEGERLQQEHEAGRLARLRERMAYMLSASEEPPDYQTIMQELNHQEVWKAGSHSVWVLRMNGAVPAQGLAAMEDDLRVLLGRFVMILPGIVTGITNEHAVVIGINKDEDLQQQKELACKLVEAWEQNIGGQGIYVGIGAAAERLESLGGSYKQAQCAARSALFHGSSAITTYTEVEQNRQLFEVNREAFMEKCEELAKQIRSHIVEGNVPKAEELLQEWFAYFSKHPGADETCIGTVLARMVSELALLAQPSGGSPAGEELERCLRELHACEQLAGMHTYTSRKLAELGDRLHAKRNRKEEYVVERVIQLIHEQYSSQELGLAYAAREVFMSPNHLGVVFKKATGKTLHEYVQVYRLALAEKLVRESAKRISSIAEEVGIPNTSYFGVLFKQAYGLSPGEYREVTKR